MRAFRDGLAEAGYIDGRNVTTQYRWADNDLARLPSLATELVQAGASVIAGNSEAAEAARSVTTSIPIVLVAADDPVQRGAGARRLELLCELVPNARIIAFLLDGRWPGGEIELAEAEAAARASGVQLAAFRIFSVSDLASVFDAFVKAGAHAAIVGASPIFAEQRHRIVPLALERKLPTMSDQRDFVLAGGLASYAASATEAYRQAGVYAGKILGGAKPSELPVLQPARFELVVNLKTAKAFGLSVPQSILLQADETVL